MFNLVKSTWLKTLQKSSNTTWPDLMDELVKKYLLKTIATVQGYWEQYYQNAPPTTKISVTLNN